MSFVNHITVIPQRQLRSDVVCESRHRDPSASAKVWFRAVFSDTESILTNKRAKRSDQGTYQIKLSNNVGYDTATCRVSVVDRPTAPQVRTSLNILHYRNCSDKVTDPVDRYSMSRGG